jgi:hypothetical protein
VKRAAQARLRSIPGVHAVGVGHKMVNGQPTSDIAIMVFVTRKKDISEIAPEEVIPTEIDGVKTDVYESSAPRHHGDRDGKLYKELLGGIQIEGVSQSGFFSDYFGTLGFFARSKDPVPKIYAVTCWHLFPQTERSSKGLDVVTSDHLTFTFVGTNKAGCIVDAEFQIRPTQTTPKNFSTVLYTTSTGDTLSDIAKNLAKNVTDAMISGVTASAQGTSVTFSTQPSDVEVNRPVTTSGAVQAMINGNKIVMAGVATRASGAFVSINVGGTKPTFGVFASLNKGAAPPTNATAVADAVQKAALPGITAQPSGTQVTIQDSLATLEEIECATTDDIRVAQPKHPFCSPCSHCCGRRIGLIAAGRREFDVALVQLDPGVKYKAEIADLGPITGTQPVTATQVGVRVRGIISKQAGTILALDQTGYVLGDENEFSDHYDGAFSIESNSATAFSEDGDSGSAILSKDENKVMGLLFGGADKFTLAMPIEPILAALDLVVETANVPGDVRTVPAALMTSMAALDTTPVFLNDLTVRLQNAHNEIAATRTGAELVAAVERNVQEAQHLINTNKRVATVWHRSGGPQIVQAVLQSLHTPDSGLPQEIGDKPVKASLRKVQEIFSRYASAAFATDLSQIGPRIIAFWGLSYNQILAMLQATASTE